MLPPRKNFLFSTALSFTCLVALSACDNGFMRYITGEREAQYVDGPRRTPPLNPRGDAALAQAPMAAAPVDAPAPAMQAAPPSAPPTSSREAGFFDRVGSWFQPDEPVHQVSARAREQAMVERRPLPGNPQLSLTTETLEPPAPLDTMPLVTPEQQAAPIAIAAPMPAMMAAPQPQPEAMPFAAVDQKTLDRDRAAIAKETKKRTAAKKKKAAKQAAAKPLPADVPSNPVTGAYPELSTVPPAPETLGEVQEEKADRAQELIDAQQQAESGKKALEETPFESLQVPPAAPAAEPVTAAPVELSAPPVLPLPVEPAPAPTAEALPVPALPPAPPPPPATTSSSSSGSSGSSSSSSSGSSSSSSSGGVMMPVLPPPPPPPPPPGASLERDEQEAAPLAATEPEPAQAQALAPAAGAPLVLRPPAGREAVTLPDSRYTTRRSAGY